MPALDPHPSTEELTAYSLGALLEPQAGAIEAHLDSCPECQNRAALIPGDALVSLLRSAQTCNEVLSDTPALTCAGSRTAAWAQQAEDHGTPPPIELMAHPRYQLLRPLGVGG